MCLAYQSGSKSGSGSKFQEVFDLADNYTLSDDTLTIIYLIDMDLILHTEINHILMQILILEMVLIVH